MADVTEPTASSITPTTSMERRIVSVLFADLVGFTSLSERLDAEDIATLQDAYFASVRETIERHGGVLEKFIGDAAMAVFGTPQTRDDDAERAVRAGLALIGAVEQVGARLALEPGELQLRVGINSGEVVHATDGPDAGRVTGDTVNTAARLQAAAEPPGVQIGELTALAVRGSIELTEMGELNLKGKAEPVRAWQAHAVRPEPSRDAALGDLRAPILGRDEELARLEAMRSGRITIIAPPGVGKSRLVAELAGRAATGGARVLRARARPQAGGPYEVIAQLLAAAGAPAALGVALKRSEVHPGRR
ncbi:MAG TPA: adenylate/guanylate cyclase domain-containing protein, partial [Candidatus Limnocylindrales bacterium]|nr:adenylate/guanylate cyclase domain-containing protein [Candidatus Limnocylindrales bacterium]